MSTIVAESVPLAKLFAHPFKIIVPPFQRVYSWAAAESGQLLEDIMFALGDADDGTDPDADYFLGTMLFLDRRDLAVQPDAERIVDVVDGLQRLTTLSILFCVLREATADEAVRKRLTAAIGAGRNGSAEPRLTLRGADANFFAEHVVCGGTGGDNQARQDHLSLAQLHMLAVRDHFRTAVNDLGPAEIARLAHFLLDKCCVVRIVTKGIDRAHRMFMVLNEAGKELSRHDILKAVLLGSVAPADLEQTTAIWESIEGRLGKDFEQLFSHIRSMHARPETQIVSCIKGVAVDSGGAKPFITNKLTAAAAAFDDIRHLRHSGSAQSPTIVRLLTYLDWLQAADWMPAAMMGWMEKGKDPAQLATFLAKLDRLAYALRIMNLGTGRRARRMAAVASAIRKGEDIYAPSSPLSLSRDDLRTLHRNLRELHVRSTATAKLVLLRLNDHISRKPQALPAENLTIEHVLPRKPALDSQWRAWFPDAAERERYTESLGNLVLVTKQQNEKAANLDYARKRDVLLKTRGVIVPAINQSLHKHKEWKVAQIRQREAELYRYLDQLWQFGDPGPRVPAVDGEGRPLGGPQAAAPGA